MKEQGARSQEPGDGVHLPNASVFESGFRRVIAWQKADDLFAAIYPVANTIASRDYWLRSQLLRAARSVSANIAEGHGRGTTRDYIRFLETATSSLNEVENDLHLLRRNSIVSSELIDSVEPIRIETGKLLTGLLRAMRKKLTSDGDWQRRQISEERGIYLVEEDMEFEPDGADSLAPGS